MMSNIIAAESNPLALDASPPRPPYNRSLPFACVLSLVRVPSLVLARALTPRPTRLQSNCVCVLTKKQLEAG